MSTVKIVSWNIAGGFPVNSLERFDYAAENIDYFAKNIRELNPDIICLQETHTSLDGKRIIAQEIATKIGFQHIYNSPASPSHIDQNYELGTAIISRFKFDSQSVFWYPDPEMKLFFQDGKKAITHKKNLQLVKINDFFIANHQLLPLRLFGYEYNDKNEGSNFALQIDNVMKNLPTPLIWCGDFNFDDPKTIYKTLLDFELEESLPDKGTRPKADGIKSKPDHIFYSKSFSLLESSVIETNSDHYLCYAEFKKLD